MLTDLLWFYTVALMVVAVVHSQTEEPVEAERNSVANCVTNTTETRSVPTLQFVIVVSRHGSRGPLITIPTSQYQSNDTTVWPYGAGQLTQRGHIQMYNLGEKVRSLYNGFLDQIYRPEDFLAQSSPVVRTIQSAELFLAGLFPPSGFQVWNKNLPWQPVPVFSSALDHIGMVFIKGENLCPRFKEAQRESVMKVYQLKNPSLDSFVDYAIPYTGIDVNHILKEFGSLYKFQIVILVWESLQYLAENGLPLPDWTMKIYPEPLTSLYVNIIRAACVGSQDQIRYSEGELFQEMVGLLKSKANNTLSPDRRMFYYSGHDYTIMALLGMLNQQEVYVNTGSAMIYELHRHPSSGRFYVQVLYIDGASRDLEPSEVKIAGCDHPCDFHLLLNITEKYYNITNWEEECLLSPSA